MQRPVKVEKERHGDQDKKHSNMKWWITAGVLAFVSVCAFIGITVWLGLNIKLEDDSRNVGRNSHSNREVVSPTSSTEETAEQKGNGNSQRLESDDRYTEKKGNDELEVAGTTELSGDLDGEALIVEVPKPQTSPEMQNGETHTTALHQKVPLTSGSPLHPQPIPESPTFVPEDRTTGQTVTPKTVPTSFTNSRQSTSEQEPTTAPTEMTTGTKPDISKPEHKADELEGELFHDPSEEIVPTALLDQINKNIRRFDISDAVNVKGEHFMPQNFEYPHDRDIIPSQHFGNQHLTDSLVREQQMHEVTEDGVDRDGIPSLDHDDGLFYVPSYPDRYDGEDPDLAENPLTTFLQGRLQELYNWLSTDEDLTGKYNSDTSDNSDNSSLSGDFMKVLLALNRSLNEGNSSFLLGQLKDMYYNDATLNVTEPAVLQNSSNLVSFGLLAFDLLLLRNVQQIAWEEENVSSEEMMRDPQVLALNALFMPPDKVRQLQVGSHSVNHCSTKRRSVQSFIEEVLASILPGELGIFVISLRSQQPESPYMILKGCGGK
jgi:hypothetical protein